MRTFLILCTLFLSMSTRAQVPVIDATAIAKAIATLAEIKKQVRLMTDNLATAREIHVATATHQRRYAQALTKRGVVPSRSLNSSIAELEGALGSALGYVNPQELARTYNLYEMPPDPLTHDRTVTTRTMGTVSRTIEALSVHGQQLRQAHEELERFKREIARNPEPQQMQDVQASLQVLEAREVMLTRQALITLANMEAIRAAQALEEKAQRKAAYDTFIGNTDWLGEPKRYKVRSFLRMPGQ